jgi:hypothetical protein
MVTNPGAELAIARMDTRYGSSDQLVILVLIKHRVWAKLNR